MLKRWVYSFVSVTTKHRKLDPTNTDYKGDQAQWKICNENVKVQLWERLEKLSILDNTNRMQ